MRGPGQPNLSIGASLDPGVVGPPHFVGATNFRLPPGSPAIDSGDPLLVTLPTVDYDGSRRPVDGDGDDARRDIGAYEYQPPPKISKLRFRRSSGTPGAGRLSLKLSVAASIKAVFRARRPHKAKARVIRLMKLAGKKGRNSFRLKRGSLKAVPYKLSISVTGATGNRSAVKKVGVKATG